MRISRAAPPLLTLALSAIILAGCADGATNTDLRTDTSSEVDDLVYSMEGSDALMVNACLPAVTEQPTGAVLLIHGGGFEKGGRNSDSMMEPCRQLAAVGMAGFSIDYRLTPEATYPAQVDDVATAVEWLCDPAQADRFGIDPDRIGLFGSSAGAIMAASVGTAGSGSLEAGSRVAAVVALSPAADLTEAGLALGDPSRKEVALILQYLGCRELSECRDARSASPLYSVDSTDPPFFIAISDDEIVPVEQGRALRDALDTAGVDVVYDERSGSRHAISMLDTTMKKDVLDFLQRALRAA